jgi:hypothetical protein
MPNRIFISYRREDGAASARSICDRLTQVFGSANVFMDVNSLVAGQRFDVELNKALGQCKVFLAIIGPRWMELLAKRESEGEHDYVRQELATALKRNMVVIPVLAEGASLPRNTSLPPDIDAIVMHQKQEVTHERFAHDVNDLVRAIRLGAGEGEGAKWRLWAGAAAVIAIAAVSAVAYFGGFAAFQKSDGQRKSATVAGPVSGPVANRVSAPAANPGSSSAANKANDHRIQVYNQGNVAIDAVHSSPCTAERFGTNKLGERDFILPGNSKVFDMSDGFVSDCCRDLRVVFRGGKMETWWKANVCKEASWKVRN